MICVVKSKKFWGISLFEVEKLFKNKRFTKVSDRILVHMTVPLFFIKAVCRFCGFFQYSCFYNEFNDA